MKIKTILYMVKYFHTCWSWNFSDIVYIDFSETIYRYFGIFHKNENSKPCQAVVE